MGRGWSKGGETDEGMMTGLGPEAKKEERAKGRDFVVLTFVAIGSRRSPRGRKLTVFGAGEKMMTEYFIF